MAVLVNSSKISSSKKPQFHTSYFGIYRKENITTHLGENNLNAKTQQG